jgi:hypothetical protein
MRMQRPTGVTILAILAAIGGVVAILGGIVLLGVGNGISDTLIPGMGGLLAVLGLLTILVGIAELALAYGAWTLKPWAWMLGIIVEVANIVVAILQFRSATASSTLISIVIAGIILYYLYQPHVRRAFGQAV